MLLLSLLDVIVIYVGKVVRVRCESLLIFLVMYIEHNAVIYTIIIINIINTSTS